MLKIDKLMHADSRKSVDLSRNQCTLFNWMSVTTKLSNIDRTQDSGSRSWSANANTKPWERTT